MRLSESLRKEFYTEPEGKYVPAYYRYLGYRESFAEEMAILRAKGIAALFGRTEPTLHPSDLIVGDNKGLYCKEEDWKIREAEYFAGEIGQRNFQTNADHFSPDYRRMLTLGVPGVLKAIDASLKKHGNDPEKQTMLNAMKIAMEGFGEMISNYRKKAEELVGQKGYCNQRLAFIRENLKQIESGVPQTFAQALQLVWLCHTAFVMEGRRAMALGRMDQYLYPFFEKDVREERLTEADAVELLENVFTKIEDTDVVNICIGGMNREKKCQVNRLSWCIVEAVQNGNAPGPNLSARVTPDFPEDFLIRCLQSIGSGIGYPALMNDEVNLAALSRYGYEEEDLYDYSMVGCIENFITGKQPPWTDGRFDAPRFLDYVFFDGVSVGNGSSGLALGAVETIGSMQEFMERLEAQLAYGVKKYMSLWGSRNFKINQAYFPEPFLSCFCEDCIGRGMDINNGGAKYPSVHGVGLMGVGTMADSLAAVETVVFEDKQATLAQVRDALAANFEGYEELHEKLLAAPKYGNNRDAADKYAVWFADFLYGEFSKYRSRDGGGIYGAMAANVQNVSAGKEIGATPDGRKAGEPLSDAASPSYGKDTRGVTVTLNSVAKPDYTKMACGTVVNQKFSPAMFRGENLKKMAALVRTYFKKGGQELQINATSRKVLQDAMEHPEQYQNLVVRVSGFSGYYVKLSKEVQLDILNRTQQEV